MKTGYYVVVIQNKTIIGGFTGLSFTVSLYLCSRHLGSFYLELIQYIRPYVKEFCQEIVRQLTGLPSLDLVF